MDFIQNILEFITDQVNNDVIFQILLMSIILDLITGFARAIRERAVNSTTGINGWMRHGLVVIITTVVSYFAVILGANWFSYAFAIGFIVQYVVSIAENWNLMGYPLPSNIEEMLKKLEAPKFKDFSITIEHDKNDDDKMIKLKNELTDTEGADDKDE